jgi:adenine-specific DNA-methyltransferase
MEQRELQKLLNQPYNQENWKQIVKDVFPNVSIFATPTIFPISNPKIEKFSQLGNVRLQDGKNLALFELILNDSVNLSRNRVELNNEISKYIDQEQIHGVLSVFEQGNEDYRFTFSARSTEFDEQEGDFISKKTDTKRFTYVLGKNESCRTAAERFHKLSEKKGEATIKAIQNAFSVEQVSKEFFDKYTKQFKKFWTYLASTKEYDILFDHSDKAKQELKIRDFTKKLLGRIVFLHFLQKKEWMGCKAGTKEWIEGDKRFMQNLYQSFSDKEHFYSKSLSKLFFDVLNKKREGDVFNIEGLRGNLNNTKIPYLNGGLFDTDEDISRKIDFPQEYFETLFNFFGEYNFTIDENDPNEHEVGIDPEMLGHIFENLLEDNKDKGAFYTPKVIVQYMCQESIIEYLKTSLNLTNTHKDEIEAIEQLIRENLAEHVSDLDLVTPISAALHVIKVCDPAIGSGAFPMGILNEIYQAVENLYYLQPDSVALIWKISETEWQPHLVKKNIIQHSIYGVDIESGAVDIARLRFWLALVVDETEPLPLPNLDYKIMQGNSLLESFEGIDLSQISNESAYESAYESDQLDIFTGEAKKKVQISIHFEDIEGLMEQYFNASNSDTKKEIHKKIDEQVTNHIRFTLTEHKKVIEVKAKKLQKDLLYKETAAPTWQQKEKIRIESKEAKELIKLNKELSNYTNKEIALSKLSNSNDRPFFLWHLFFKDVFENGGFDIVIANPPYVGVKGNSEIFDLLKTGSLAQFAKGRAELFYFFFHLAIKILKKNGVSCFITTNYFPTASDGNLLRQDMKQNTTLLKFLSFNELKIFNTAPGQHNAITLFQKGVDFSKNLQSIDCSSKGIITTSKLRKIVSNSDLDTEYYNVSQLEIYEGEESYMRFKGVYGANLLDRNIFEKFEKLPKLITLSHVRQGLRTGIDKISDSLISKHSLKFMKNEGVFIISDSEKKRIGAGDNKLVKKLFKNSDIDHYIVNSNTNKNLIYVDKSISEKELKSEFNNIYAHLKKYQELIQKIRGKNNEGVDDWYSLDRPREEWIFEAEKVVAPQRSKNNKFGYSDSSFFASADVYYIVPFSKEISAKYLTVLLNSRLYYFWYYNRGKRKGDMLELYQKPLSETPVLIPKKINKFEGLFNEIYKLKLSKMNTSLLEQEADLLIYKCFELTYSEVLIVEPEFATRKSKNEYDAFKIE